jgi:heparan-alpha-glucosaminide N-acetyltransferase
VSTATQPEPVEIPEGVTRAPVGRIVSLDWARGILLVAQITMASALLPRPEFLTHAKWVGITPFDMVFPLFVTLSGCGLAFAYRNAVGWGKTVRRSVVLLAVGLVYNAYMYQTIDVSQFRVTGPLQVYSILVLVIGVLHLWARTPRAWMVITAVVASVHAFLLAAWQAGCPGGELLPTCNPSRVVDVAVLGASHIYAHGEAGYDPEGLIAAMGALVTAVAGTTAGHLALSGRRNGHGPKHLIAWAAVVLAGALATSLFLPAFKRLWTTPFALGLAAGGILMLAIGIMIMDRPAPSWWERVRHPSAWPLVALGRNSLLVYFGVHVVFEFLHRHGGETVWAVDLAEAVDMIGQPSLSFALLMLVFWVAVTGVLHRYKIYLRP